MKLREYMQTELTDKIKNGINSTTKVEFVIQDYRGYVYDVYNHKFFRSSVEKDIPYLLSSTEWHDKLYQMFDTDFVKCIDNFDNTIVIICKMNVTVHEYARGWGYIFARVQRKLLKLELVEHKTDPLNVLFTTEQVETPVATQLMMEALEHNEEYANWTFVNHKIVEENGERILRIECIKPE